jgi:hypothetical protein
MKKLLRQRKIYGLENVENLKSPHLLTILQYLLFILWRRRTSFFNENTKIPVFLKSSYYTLVVALSLYGHLPGEFAMTVVQSFRL